MLTFILMIVALALFILAAVGIPLGKINLGWLGLACLTLVLVLGQDVPVLS